MERVQSYDVVGGRLIVLQPGDATRYEILLAHRVYPNEMCIGILNPKSNSSAFSLPCEWLEREWQNIQELDVHERVAHYAVQWLAGEENINPYTAAAVLEAFGAWFAESVRG